MVRVAAMVLCSVICSSAVIAFPRISITSAPSFIMVAGEDGAFVWNPTEKECREWPHWAPTDGCAKYNLTAGAPAPGNQATTPFNSGTSTTLAQPSPPATHAKREPELNLPWPKPLTPQRNVAALAPGLLQEGLHDKRLRKMVGQLLVSGFEGRTAAAPGAGEVSNALREGRIAGILVRGTNIASYRQLKALLSYIRKSSHDGSAFIAIDQPGGSEAVLSEERGFAAYGAASAVGSAMPPYQAQLFYRDMAAELSSSGINFNIGPSGDACRESGVDLSADCFGNIPSSAAAFGRAFTFGHHDRGVLTALRHAVQQTFGAAESPSLAMLHNVIRSETSDAIVVRMKTSELLRLPGPRPGSSYLRDSIQSCGPQQALLVDWNIESDGAPVRYRDSIARAFQAGADMIIVREPSRLPGAGNELKRDFLAAAPTSDSSVSDFCRM
jgi:hypothetical protein